MIVRIYKPGKTALNSAWGENKAWILECCPDSRRIPEPLMGWVSAKDTNNQIRITFDSKEEAVAFARRNGLNFNLQDSREHKLTPKSYAHNFAFNRRSQWTH
ncbi:hypothetical protein P856_60 [Candidatus Endolissoclinum faulkneri L5]|uniref:ETC complex I subunit n=1 Tax=Candidatus Endolissoclinum faulkneri L5 TaxID=1401328 RepID=V9TUE4_9PROT|nr:NADH dehydrogenase ubiquinone Fe-S protein 4 [Candidatus Endolissoclinum faulkneri]AHC73308.1 hypothetical protein P856_60 [Candidatus Endolissoclinum faulkneri L5]